MLQTLYPTIGSKVNYIRQAATGVPEQGAGIILGLALDAHKRLIAHIDTGVEKINVNFANLNPDEQKSQEFSACMDKVKQISDEGNAKVREIVEEYNKLVDVEYNTFFGEAVVFEELIAPEKVEEVAEIV